MTDVPHFGVTRLSNLSKQSCTFWKVLGYSVLVSLVSGAYSDPPHRLTRGRGQGQAARGRGGGPHRYCHCGGHHLLALHEEKVRGVVCKQHQELVS